MVNLDNIALNNIRILADLDSKTNFINFKNKIELETKEKDDTYENITEFEDIEYAIYFTYNHIATMLKKRNTNYSRKELIYLMEDAYDTIYDLYNETIDSNERIDNIFTSIGLLIDKIIDHQHYYNCYYTLTDYFDYLCSGFKCYYNFSIELHKKYIDYIDYNESDDNESDNNESDNNESDNNESDNNESDNNESDDKNKLD